MRVCCRCKKESNEMFYVWEVFYPSTREEFHLLCTQSICNACIDAVCKLRDERDQMQKKEKHKDSSKGIYAEGGIKWTA